MKKQLTVQDCRIGIKTYKKKIAVSLYSRCGCGKYRGEKYLGIICEVCGMEIRRQTKIDIPKIVLNYYLAPLKDGN